MFWNFFMLLMRYFVAYCWKLCLLNVTFIWNYILSALCFPVWPNHHFNPVSTIFVYNWKIDIPIVFSYVINKISNSLSFITKFITFVGKNYIMLGRASHNIMFANSCNKFSNKWQLIRDSIFITSRLSFKYHGNHYTHTISNQITGLYWPHNKAFLSHVTNGIQDFVKCCIKSWVHLNLQPQNMLFGGLQPSDRPSMGCSAPGFIWMSSFKNKSARV